MAMSCDGASSRWPAHLDAELPAWIASEVRFPNSVVDRLVPAATERVLTLVQTQLGLADLAAVVTERHRSWVIESVDGLPPIADVGAQVVDSIAPFERRKLWLLNGPHSALAYCGLLAGRTTIAAAADIPISPGFVDAMVSDILEVADLPASVEPRRFAARRRRASATRPRPYLCPSRCRRLTQVSPAALPGRGGPPATESRHR